MAYILWLALATVGYAKADDKITLQYTDRPPFFNTQSDGSVSGLVATPAIHAFQKAGIPFEWAEIPFTRQLLLLKQNQGRLCSVGWYKTPDREAFARFSLPVSQDSSMIALLSPGFRPKETKSVEKLLSDDSILVLTKQSISYGPYLDAQLAKMAARRLVKAVGYGAIVEMIVENQAQVTFIPLEEARYYAENLGFGPEQFHILRFPEIPPGEKRYIACAHRIDESILQRLNAAITPPP